MEIISVKPDERILIETFMGDAYGFYGDYNTLMPVVEKIESMGYQVNFSKAFVGENATAFIGKDSDMFKATWLLPIPQGFGKTKLIAVYSVVVEFIKFYNKQPK